MSNGISKNFKIKIRFLKKIGGWRMAFIKFKYIYILKKIYSFQIEKFVNDFI